MNEAKKTSPNDRQQIVRRPQSPPWQRYLMIAGITVAVCAGYILYEYAVFLVPEREQIQKEMKKLENKSANRIYDIKMRLRAEREQAERIAANAKATEKEAERQSLLAGCLANTEKAYRLQQSISCKGEGRESGCALPVKIQNRLFDERKQAIEECSHRYK